MWDISRWYYADAGMQCPHKIQHLPAIWQYQIDSQTHLMQVYIIETIPKLSVKRYMHLGGQRNIDPGSTGLSSAKKNWSKLWCRIVELSRGVNTVHWSNNITLGNTRNRSRSLHNKKQFANSLNISIKHLEFPCRQFTAEISSFTRAAY